MKLPTIRLASKSPRRKLLLEQLNVDFSVHPIICDESYPVHLSGSDVAEYIVRKKAREAKSQINMEGPILCADTIVCFQNQILEKPSSPEEAKMYLNKLSGNKHTVVTAVSIADNSRSEVFCVESIVYLNDSTEPEIQYYVEEYKPYDKAGAYAIQEWIGYSKIRKINGSYTNIIGLPTTQRNLCVIL